MHFHLLCRTSLDRVGTYIWPWRNNGVFYPKVVEGLQELANHCNVVSVHVVSYNHPLLAIIPPPQVALTARFSLARWATAHLLKNHALHELPVFYATTMLPTESGRDSYKANVIIGIRQEGWNPVRLSPPLCVRAVNTFGPGGWCGRSAK